jgi:hypothetical protein
MATRGYDPVANAILRPFGDRRMQTPWARQAPLVGAVSIHPKEIRAVKPLAKMIVPVAVEALCASPFEPSAIEAAAIAAATATIIAGASTLRTSTTLIVTPPGHV